MGYLGRRGERQGGGRQGGEGRGGEGSGRVVGGMAAVLPRSSPGHYHCPFVPAGPFYLAALHTLISP